MYTILNFHKKNLSLFDCFPEFKTYNPTINDGSSRKTLVFIISSLGFNLKRNTNFKTFIHKNNFIIYRKNK